MPLYEYRCRRCSRKFTVLVGMTAEAHDDACPHCGAKDAERLISRFRRGRSEDERVEELADRLELMGEPESHREMRALAKEMGSALDEDVSEELEEMLETDLESEQPRPD